MTKEEILAKLPYGEHFLFVNSIHSVSERGISGTYTFAKDAWFYRSHFKDMATTPGVLLIECMAQIGLVCFGIWLKNEYTPTNKTAPEYQVAFTESEVQFFSPVYPEETVTVESELIYFRFNKLKCKIKMNNAKGTLVCKGVLSGMLIKKSEL